MKLRPYQERAVRDLRAQYAAGRRAPVLVMPTGSGKTPTAAEIVRLCVGKGLRAGVLSNRVELISQVVNKLADAGLTDVRVIQAENDNQSTSPIFVASIPTLVTERWSGQLPPADLLVADECHHSPSETWAGLLARYPNAKLLGLTATPQRGDGRSLQGQFDSLVVGSTVAELTALGHLVPAKLFAPSRILNSRDLAQDPVDAYFQYARGQKTIIFCSTVAAARQTAESFIARGVSSEWVSGASSGRDEIISRFSARKFEVLVNVSLVVEGFDDPESSAGILARRFTYVGGYLQALGRFLRPFPGKQHATIVDLCGSALVHGTPDLERTYSLTGKGISSTREPIRQCQQCGAVFVSASVSICPYCEFKLPALTRAQMKALGLKLEEVSSSTRPTSWPMRAKKRGLCSSCHGFIEQGAWIVYSSVKRQAMHTGCAAKQASKRAA